MAPRHSHDAVPQRDALKKALAKCEGEKAELEKRLAKHQGDVNDLLAENRALRRKIEGMHQQGHRQAEEVRTLERSIAVLRGPASTQSPEVRVRSALATGGGMSPRSPGVVGFEGESDPGVLRRELERVRSSISSFKADSKAKLDFLRQQLEAKEEEIDRLKGGQADASSIVE